MKSVQFWDRMAGLYDRQVGKVYGQAYRDTILQSRDFLDKDDRLLDFACGTGITALEMAPLVRDILGIDLSGGMLEIARGKAGSAGIHNIDFRCLDIFSEDLKKESFDVITAFNILYFLEDMEAALIRIHTLLKPGGICLSATDCMGEHPNLKIRLQLYLGRLGMIPCMRGLKTTELLRKIEDAGFSVERSVSLHPDPPNLFVAARKI